MQKSFAWLGFKKITREFNSLGYLFYWIKLWIPTEALLKYITSKTLGWYGLGILPHKIAEEEKVPNLVDIIVN